MKKAFTLIELLVSISIVGILAGFIIVQVSGAINTANDGKKKANLSSIKKAIILYGVENANSYPIESGCTIGSCTTLDPALEGFLPENIEGTYTYESDGTSFTLSSVLSSGYAYTYDSTTNSFATEEPEDGVCGTANKTYLYTDTSYGTDTFCASGTSTPSSPSFPGLGSSTTWTCPGTNGGSSSSCTASRSEEPINGSCGTKNGKYASTTPTETEACITGTITGMTGSYSWTCAGSNGGSSPSCATVAATYAVQSFATVGTTSWTVPDEVTSIEYLVVAGGGAGGGYSGNSQNGGGGGAGGMLTGTGTIVSGSSYTITVGAGGVAPRGNGGNSSISGIATAIGGGGGGDTTGTTGYTGGSSGGSSGAYSPVAPTPSDLSQGHAGSRGDNPACYTGGGGGGKSADGGVASHAVGGAGGAGAYSSITGTSVAYAGGGGGGGGYSGTTPGAGGVGGGGTGASTQTGNATSGVANTGGGGGGTFGGIPGNGGSGVVIIKYINNY